MKRISKCFSISTTKLNITGLAVFETKQKVAGETTGY